MKCSLLVVAGLLSSCSEDPRKPLADEQRASPLAKAKSASPSEKPAKGGRRSEYTSLDPASCRLIEKNKEEGPYWRRLCKGVAGYSIEWSESDLREGLELIAPDGRRRELHLSDIVAKGAFNSLGPRIEWRGDANGRPDTIVVRMLVANGAEPLRPDRSLLAVSRLKSPACVVAIVEPSPRQSEEARRIADGRLPGCLSDWQAAPGPPQS